MPGKKLLMQLLAFFIVISFLLPIVKVGSTTSIKLDWVFVKIAFLVLVLLFEKLKKIKFYKRYILLLLLIFVATLISTYIGGYYYLYLERDYGMPINLWMIDRITTFIFFSYIVYRGWVKFEVLRPIVSLVFLAGLFFGIIQFFDLFGAKDIALNFYLEKGSVQAYNFIRHDRIIGVAPAIITWGGISVLLFHYFFFLEKWTSIKYIGAVASILNVLMTGSRSAIAALFGSIILVFMVKAILVDRKIRSFLKIIIALFACLTMAYVLFSIYMPEQLAFLEYRFDSTREALTTAGRGAQISYYLNIFGRDWWGSIFGMGAGAISFMEIDYLYIFVAYGFVGVILHYALIYLLLKEAFKFRLSNKKLFLFVWGSTIGYLIFSVGFFFFYERYMGMPYWWLNGMVIGYLWYNKKHAYEKMEA